MNPHDDLNAARGIILGTLAMLALWGVAGLLWWLA